MNRLAKSICGLAVGGTLIVAAPDAGAQEQASAGQASRPAPSQSGPLLLQPVGSGFVFAPEVKFTTVNHSSGTLVGGYGGWLYDETFFFGGAAYWLTNGENDSSMWYGGMVAGWTVPLGERLQLGGKGLFGFGDAQLTYQYPVPVYSGGHHYAGTSNQWAWASTSFIVFEPQVTAIVRLTKTVSFDFSGGYRVIGDAGGLDHELQGGFGSVGIRFGPF